MAEKQDAPAKGEELKLLSYVSFLSRNKWRIVGVLSLIVAILLVVGLMQSLRRRRETGAFEAYSRAVTVKQHRTVNDSFSGTFFGSVSLIRAGNLLFEAEKFSEARKLFLRYLRSHPQSQFRPWVYNLVGATFEAERKYDEAIAYYSRAQGSPSLELQAKLNRGRCWELKGDLESGENPELALDYYEAARTIYRELTEPSSSTPPSSPPPATPWQRQAQSRMRFLQEKESDARQRQAEKTVDKDSV